LAASVKKRFGIDSTLIKKSGGIFEVSLRSEQGDEVLFSKKMLGRFPNAGEVEGKLQTHLGAGAGGS
jgi:hypothetical protein